MPLLLITFLLFSVLGLVSKNIEFVVGFWDKGKGQEYVDAIIGGRRNLPICACPALKSKYWKIKETIIRYWLEEDNIRQMR